jgi:hypothetical protein
MCTSNLLHDLFAFDLFVKRPVHRERRNWAADQHDPAEMTAGRGILQANFTAFKGL